MALRLSPRALLSVIMWGAVMGCSGAKHSEPIVAPPDCAVEHCSGELRWSVALRGEGSVVFPPLIGIPLDDGGIEDPNPALEPPALAFTEFVAQTGVVVMATGGVDTTFAGELLLSEEHLTPESGRGTAVLRIDGDGKLLDHVALPQRALIEGGGHPTRRVLGQDDGSYLLIEHEASGRSAFIVDSSGGQPASFPLARNVYPLSWDRDLWLSTYQGSAACREASATGVAIEHWSARGQLASRTCIDGVTVEELVSLARGGVAAIARTESIAEGGWDVEVDFGAGLRPAYTNEKYLVVWSASGKLVWAELLEGEGSRHLQRTPRDELMVLTTWQESQRWQRFAAEGGQLADGKRERNDEDISRVDNAGFFVTLDWDPFRIADAVMRKWSPQGELVWERMIAEPGERPTLQIDSAGYIYLVTNGTLAQYAP